MRVTYMEGNPTRASEDDRSIHGIFFHLLATSRSWRLSLAQGQQPPRLQPAGFESLPTVRAALVEENEQWLAWLAGMSDAQVEGDVTLLPLHGEAWTVAYWRILQHVILHNMQHYSELAKLLTDFGHSPGDLDFIFFEG